MSPSRNRFILRQTQLLLERGEQPETALDKVFSEILSAEDKRKALAIFAETQSVFKTLVQSGFMTVEKPYYDKLVELESADSPIPLKLINGINEHINQTFQLLKVRLTTGLTYAIWLLSIAAIVFNIISSSVLPQFRDIFASFGAELPLFTQLMLGWQTSIFSPLVFVLILLAFIAFVLYSVKKIGDNPSYISRFSRIPFLRKVFAFTQLLHHLNHIKILLAVGKPITGFLDSLKQTSDSIKKFAPYTLHELEMAQSLNTAQSEIEVQIAQLTGKAELIVTNATRQFIAAVMSLIISYISFVLIASYLPIFQMGAVI